MYDQLPQLYSSEASDSDEGRYDMCSSGSFDEESYLDYVPPGHGGGYLAVDWD